MAAIVELMRDVLSVIAPTTGTRATGSVTVTNTLGSDVTLPRNQGFVPIINGAERSELLFKADAGPLADDYDWVIHAGSGVVAIVSMLGGARHNLSLNTQMRMDPPVDGLNPVVTVRANMTTGVDPTWLGGVMSAVLFEQLATPDMMSDLFRSQVLKAPAVVLAWDSSTPADGVTQSMLARAGTRAARATQLYQERFNMFAIVSRLDSGRQRAMEGLTLLDDLTDWLTDRSTVDGRVFSAPSGIQILGRQRVGGPADIFQAFNVYLLQVGACHPYIRRDTRTWNEWVHTRSRTLTYGKDSVGGRITTTDDTIDMT